MEFDPKIHVTRDQVRENVRAVVYLCGGALIIVALSLLIRWLQF